MQQQHQSAKSERFDCRGFSSRYFNFKKDFEKMKHQVPDARRKSIAKGEIEAEEEEEAEE